MEDGSVQSPYGADMPKMFLRSGLRRGRDLFCSLWRVQETVWKNELRNQEIDYDQHSTRKWHPGLCLWNQNRPPESWENLPMLHGRSKRGPIQIIEFEGPSHTKPVHFGKLGPARLPFEQFGTPRNNSFKGGPDWFIDKPILLNSPKPRATKRERDCVTAFLNTTAIRNRER